MAGRNSDNAEVERKRLRQRRAALLRENEQLREEAKRLTGTIDVTALKHHGERLRRHLTQLHEFVLDLHEFHDKAGPLGS